MGTKIGVLVAVVVALVSAALYIGRLEGRLNETINARQEVTEARDEVKKTKISIDKAFYKLKEFIDEVEAHLKESNIYSLGEVACGTPRQIPVPIAGTTPDQWIVFGVNPKMHANWEDEWGDNALFTYWTDVTPHQNSASWTIGYKVEINFNTKRSEKKGKSVWSCQGRNKVPSMEFVAIKAKK